MSPGSRRARHCPFFSSDIGHQSVFPIAGNRFPFCFCLFFFALGGDEINVFFYREGVLMPRSTSDTGCVVV